MRKIIFFPTAFLAVLLMSNCTGIRYLTVETREPAQINLPSHVLSVAIVNNVVQQPDEVGHDSIPIGHTLAERTKASSDSVAVFYTEAFAQFLNEEDYFQRVIYYGKPLRDDNDFFLEKPVDPETMNRIRKETGADAIISLDKLIIETKKRGHFLQQGYIYADMAAKIHSTLRVYFPTMEGKIPAIQYNDSIRWEGFDIRDGKTYADVILPSREEATKILAVKAAEKMTYVFAPHWEMQDRWYYTLPGSLMREGETYAKGAEWSKAIERWETFFNSSSGKTDRARAAGNIALACEMMDDMARALEWAIRSNELFNESTVPSSPERKRSLLYKNEIQRRFDSSNRLNMDAF
ncbi:MAG: DUF6340 family protein [Proteiniphilum sp.]|jgi:tetratricopeptide (TPR) repeat protein|nr:DUF6340 family protein [Proteiniphilum sp.]